MSLYDLLNGSSKKCISLNETPVTQGLSQDLQRIKGKSNIANKSNPPLLLTPTEPSEQSHMPSRFQPRPPKRARQPEEQQQIDKEQPKKIKGTSNQTLKPFLRITDIQSSDKIRSQSTLHKAFQVILKMSQQQSAYSDICEQLQSLRQDLHVQEIQDQFSLRVMQFSIEVALKNNDLVNFAKAMGQLRQISLKNGYKMKPIYISLHLLYLLLNNLYSEYQHIIEHLSLDYVAHPTVRSAMQVYSLLHLGNYYKILIMYEKDSRQRILIQNYRDKLVKMAMSTIQKTIFNGQQGALRSCMKMFRPTSAK